MRGERRGVNAIDVAEAVALYRGRRETVSSLSRRYDVDYRTMRKILVNEGVEIVNPKAPKVAVARKHRTCIVCSKVEEPEVHTRVPSDADGRICSECGEYKPWVDFYPNSRGHKGRMSACRACHGARVDALRS
jgi:hypothetical protein